MPGELPRFDLSQRVAAQDAKQDKMELEIGKWVITGVAENIDRFRAAMSVPDVRMRNRAGFESNFSLLFNRPQNAQGRRKPLLFRGSDKLRIAHTRPPPPLWSGEWRFPNFVTADEYAPITTATSLRVSVNPTRFARHQRFRQVPSSNEFLYSPQHYRRRVTHEVHGEFSYDGEDNWLPEREFMEFASPARWPSLLQNSVVGFLAHFQNEMSRLNAHHGDCISVTTDGGLALNLQTTETYFEFAAESPTTEVARLETALRAFARSECTTTDHECRPPQTTTEFHSRSIHVDLGSGRELVVYAKTNKRIRFEVRHNMVCDNPFTIPTGAAPRARSRGRGGTHAPHSHVARSWNGLRRMLDYTAEDAARIVNRFFAFVQARQTSTPSPITAYLLIERILRRLPDRERAFTLIRLLAQDGAIRANVLPSDYMVDIRALAGIVQLSRNTPAQRTYILAPEYNAALLRLRELAEPTLPPPQVPQSRVRRHSTATP